MKTKKKEKRKNKNKNKKEAKEEEKKQNRNNEAGMQMRKQNSYWALKELTQYNAINRIRIYCTNDITKNQL